MSLDAQSMMNMSTVPQVLIGGVLPAQRVDDEGLSLAQLRHAQGEDSTSDRPLLLSISCYWFCIVSSSCTEICIYSMAAL